MKDKTKFLFKNIFLFTISNFIPKLLTFLFIKIYTLKLSTADYGVSDLINTTAMLLIPIFTLDIQDAVLRFAMDKNYKKEDIFTSAMKINWCGLLSIVVISILLKTKNVLNIEPYFYLYLILYYYSGAIQNSLALFCKAINAIKSIVIASVLSTFTTIILNIILLIVFDFGIHGFLISNVLGIVFFDIYILFKEKLYKYYTKSKTHEISRKMIMYSFPLIFNSISWWINNASDRYILTYISGVAVSGIYAVSYKIPSILSSFQTIFYQAWSISAIKEFDRNDKDGFIGNSYTGTNFCMVVLCSFLMICNIPLSKFLYSMDFYQAWKYIPPLLVSVVFNSMCLFIGGLFTAVKDTKSISISTILGATINLILNIILIKPYGAYGAAIATLISYLFVLILRLALLRKYIHLNTNMLLNHISYFILLIQMILAFNGNQNILYQVLLLLLLLFLYRKIIKSTCLMVLRKIKYKSN